MKFLVPVILCNSFLIALAQGPANTWYFGNKAGLDFTKGDPVALLDGAMFTEEGCSSISNQGGMLLFYTDGVTVWDRFHEPMPNGNDLTGHFTSTQSALIVPQPGSENIYYIFTATYQGETDGFRYSVVDMNLNGGLGDVIEKNTLLFTPSTEKITAVTHSNQRDIWVIAHEWDSNSFHAYLVSDDGINLNATVSSTGLIHTGGDSDSNAGAQMKASPNGSYIALILGSAVGVSRNVEVFNFNNNNGEISLYYTDANFGEFPPLYGLEFSENSQLLYVSEVPPNEDFDSNIFQYDLSLGSPAEIVDSKIVIAVTRLTGALQLGPNGKIYVAKKGSDVLGVINQPNQRGIRAEFSEDGPWLSTGESRFGLPGFVQSYFQPPEPILEMPNVFTPNGDQLNPLFRPKLHQNILRFKLKIVNRWGKEIFASNSIENGWDGRIDNKPAPSGTYYWQVIYEGTNGANRHQKGWVQLLR